MSARRLADLALRSTVPVLAAGLVAFVLVEPQAVGVAPGRTARATARMVPVEATQLVCPGPETIGIRGAGASPDRAAAPSLVAAAAPPADVRPVPAGGAAPSSSSSVSSTLAVQAGGAKTLASAATAGDGAASVGASTVRALSPVVLGAAAAAPGAVAEQRTVVASGDLRGLSSATCLPPQDDQWLVGGGSDTGRRGRLVLSNPHESTAEVSVDVLTADGAAARTTGSTVALAPHARTVLLLDALAPGAQAPVVHVRSTGGSVGAVLQDAWLEGTTPRGTDDVVASLPPATRVLVPGVRVDGAASLRLGVPGSTEAVAQVRLVGEKGPVDLPDGGVVRVAAGTSQDVDLSAVPAGAYAVVVTADVPVVAGALVQRRTGSTGAGEIAWSASSDAVTSLAGVAASDPPAGVAPAAWRTELVLSAPDDDAQVDLVTRHPDGTSTTVSVQVTGGTTKVVPIAGGSVWLRPEAGSGPVLAARWAAVSDAAGPLVTTGPLRQATLTRVPADVAPAAG